MRFFDINVLIVHSGTDLLAGGIQRVSFEFIEALKKFHVKHQVLDCSVGDRIFQIFRYRQLASFRFTHVVFMHIGLAKLMIFSNDDSKKIVFLHGIECWKKFGFWHCVYLKKINSFISNSFFTWSKFCKHNAFFRNVSHKIVHLGVGKALNFIPQSEFNPIGLIVGRLSKSEDYKGHRELIQIWPEVVKKIPKFKLWIVGDGDNIGDLRFLAVGNPNIVFFGKVSECEKEELYKKSSCFLMPSRNEGFGLVYVEAMRFGLPCLVSDMDAGQEVILPPYGGIAVNPLNKAELLAGILKLGESSGAYNIYSQFLLQRYNSFFTADSFHERVASVFSDF